MHRGGAAEVLEVHAPILIAGELRVAGDHRGLAHARDPADAERRTDRALVHGAAARERRVLLVQGQHASAQALVLERLAQHARGGTGRPSSVKPSAPCPAQLGHLSQLDALEAARDRREKPTGTRASRAAASRSERSSGAESITGSVLGIAITAPNPPAAAARVPVSRSSLCSWPGLRRCTCGSKNAGSRCLPAPSTTSDRPRRIELAGRGDLARSAVAHEHVVAARRGRVRGSSTCAPRSTGVRGAAAVQRRSSPAIRQRRGAEVMRGRLTPAVARGRDGTRARPTAAHTGRPCARPRPPPPVR